MSHYYKFQVSERILAYLRLGRPKAGLCSLRVNTGKRSSSFPSKEVISLAICLQEGPVITTFVFLFSDFSLYTYTYSLVIINGIIWFCGLLVFNNIILSLFSFSKNFFNSYMLFSYIVICFNHLLMGVVLVFHHNWQFFNKHHYVYILSVL